MTMHSIPGLTYNGHPCSYDDGVIEQPPIEQPPIEQPPIEVPGNVRVIKQAWETSIGRQTEHVAAGEVLAFELNPPTGYGSNGAYCSFSQSPTGGNDYFDRQVCVSEQPGVFNRDMGQGALAQGQEVPIYFTVGGYPIDKYGRPITTNANLTAGRRYYANVRQVDPNVACSINYSLTVA